MTKFLKSTITTAIVFLFFIIGISVFAENEYTITPNLTDNEIEHSNFWINLLWEKWWEFRNRYNTAANDLSFSERRASWILTRDDIMTYMTMIISFLSQIWIAVWIIFIMYTWVKYMISVFNDSKAPKSIIKNAIIWIIIVIFSYAILRAMMLMVWFQ